MWTAAVCWMLGGLTKHAGMLAALLREQEPRRWAGAVDGCCEWHSTNKQTLHTGMKFQEAILIKGWKPSGWMGLAGVLALPSPAGAAIAATGGGHGRDGRWVVVQGLDHQRVSRSLEAVI